MSNKRHEKTCEYCGASFLAKTTLAKYCSERCLREADKANKRGYKEKPLKICEQCGKEFPVNRSDQKFCSKKCYSRYRAIHIEKTCFDHGELTKTCSVCGKEFKTNKTRKYTCSIECRKYRHDRQSDRRYKGIKTNSLVAPLFTTVLVGTLVKSSPSIRILIYLFLNCQNAIGASVKYAAWLLTGTIGKKRTDIRCPATFIRA